MSSHQLGELRRGSKGRRRATKLATALGCVGLIAFSVYFSRNLAGDDRVVANAVAKANAFLNTLNEQERGDAPSFRRLLDDIAEFIAKVPRPVNRTSPRDLGFGYDSTLSAAQGPPFLIVSGYASVGNPITGPRNTAQNTYELYDSIALS